MQQPINDRTRREISREAAWAIWSADGYDRWTFVLTENESHGRTFENASGFTHRAENANDHSWRLIAVGGKWYTYYTDYSPREEGVISYRSF